MIEKLINDLVRNVPDFPKAGILFKDITPLFLHPGVCREVVKKMAEQAASSGVKIDAIAGVESRGFLFGIMLAQELNVPFHLIRKKGKLPGKTVEFSYQLEYGSATVELHQGFVKANENVLIHDDVLATGGTARAAAELIKMEGGNVAGFAFVMELAFLDGKKLIEPYSTNIHAVVSY
jgi:adenine phosphoribosyltransferase